MINSRLSLPQYIEKAEAHKRAVEFMHESTAKDGVEYKWVWEYAKELWELRSKVFNVLDDKADGIIKYLGGGTGLFAIGLLAKADSTSSYLNLVVLTGHHRCSNFDLLCVRSAPAEHRAIIANHKGRDANIC
jgi:hypothetical protein